MELIKKLSEVDKSKYIKATYWIKSGLSLFEAAKDIALGQSVGNPSVRSVWETDQLFEQHSCFIVESNADYRDYLLRFKEGVIQILFPLANIDFATDGISQLLCQLMGGQMDIDHIQKCHLIELSIPQQVEYSLCTKTTTIQDVRAYTECWNRPLLGAILKPKVVPNASILEAMVKELAMGGVNFIKEDEIMASPPVLPLEKRVPVVQNVLKDYPNIIYAYCINGDAFSCMTKAEVVSEGGGNAVHINFWSGLGTYALIRRRYPELFIHFQKSGDRILTNPDHNYHIAWDVICKLAGIMGVDFIHAGMIGGYMQGQDQYLLAKVIPTLHKYNVIPALSCGMHPGLVDRVTSLVGIDYMANVGGAIHGHPKGTLAGARAMRHAIDKAGHEEEYKEAIEKWGYVNPC